MFLKGGFECPNPAGWPPPQHPLFPAQPKDPVGDSIEMGRGFSTVQAEAGLAPRAGWGR